MPRQTYNKYIITQKRIGRNVIKPQRIYNISLYRSEYDRTSTGKTSMVFVTGIFEGKLNCVKLNDIEPKVFFKWIGKLKTPVKKRLSEIRQLEDGLKKTDSTGRMIFNNYLKQNAKIYNSDTYRTYTKDRIQYVSEVILKPEVFLKYLNVELDD